MTRIEYLQHISQFTEKPIKQLYKKEVESFVFTIFEHMNSAVSFTDEMRFGKYNNGSIRGHLAGTYFTYNSKFCHFHFHELTEPSEDIWYVLKKELKYTDNEFDGLMRYHVKKFIKSKNLNYDRKIKFFRKRLS